MCEEYQGWSNRETWCANLWIENERSLYEWVRDQANIAFQNGEGDSLDAYYLGEVIRDFIENQVLTYSEVKGDERVFMMLTDIGSLYRVSWQEIAGYLLDQAKEEVNA